MVEAVARVRRLIDWESLEDEYSPNYQKYNKAVNEVVVRHFTDLIPVRQTRERLNFHVLRSVYARIAVYWYCPPEVADLTFMAQIQGHRHILEPDVEPGETEEDVKNKQLSYAASAHYFDYKIGKKLPDGSWQVVGDQGIKLGLPGVQRLKAFPAASAEEQGQVQEKRKKGKGARAKKESTSNWAPVTVRRQSRDWFRELSEGVKGGPSRPSERDDAFLRRLLTLYLVSDQAALAPALTLSLDQIEVSEKTRDLFRRALALAGTTDVLSFLVAAAEPEAQRLVEQASRYGARRYEMVPTDKLNARDPESSNERFRRAVYWLMKYNREAAPMDRWYFTVLAIQKLVGGNKKNITAYLDAHAEEIATHHRELGIEPGFNRKPGKVQIQDKVTVPNEPEAFPWGQPAPSAESEGGSTEPAS